MTRGEYDVLAAWSVCRLGRSLPDLLSLLAELQARGVDLYLHQQALNTGTPSGRALFGMLGGFGEFERSMIRDRVLAGLERARRDNKRPGHLSTLFSGSRVRRWNSTTMASSAGAGTALRGTVGPIGASAMAVLLRHLVTGAAQAVPLGQGAGPLLQRSELGSNPRRRSG